MFENVPARIWLLITIAAVAYAPVLYLYRYIAHSPSRRDITQPPEDLSWRTSSQLARNLVILAALVGLAIFIFTPAAAQLAHSPNFWPILIAAGGIWALFTVPKGLQTGQIEPFIRGVYTTYERQAQPKRFWASMGWNTFLGCLCLWLALEISEQSVQERCLNERYTYAPREALSACNRLIDSDGPLGHLSLSDAFMYRGIAHYGLQDYKLATADYAEAIRLQSDYFEAYYNRGLSYQQIDDSQRAIADFTAAIRLRPDNADAHFRRGYEYKRIGDFQRAVSDFSEVIRLAPDHADAYYFRGTVYEDLGNTELAALDFAAAARLDPTRTNPYSWAR